MYLKFNCQVNIDPNLISNACSQTELKLTSQVAKDTAPFVPALTLAFSNSTRIVGNNIIYSGIQARMLWEGKVMVDSATGKGARYLGDEIGYRFPKGASLVASDRNLNYTKSVHEKAQDHWCEASKAQNMEKWVRVAEKLMEDEMNG
jgi:hypothetical protein